MSPIYAKVVCPLFMRDADNQAVAGALVEGSWSNGSSGSGSCTTDSAGLCSATKNNLKSSVGSVLFTLDNISGPEISYTPDNPAPSIELFNPP